MYFNSSYSTSVDSNKKIIHPTKQSALHNTQKTSQTKEFNFLPQNKIHLKYSHRQKIENHNFKTRHYKHKKYTLRIAHLTRTDCTLYMCARVHGGAVGRVFGARQIDKLAPSFGEHERMRPRFPPDENFFRESRKSAGDRKVYGSWRRSARGRICSIRCRYCRCLIGRLDDCFV